MVRRACYTIKVFSPISNIRMQRFPKITRGLSSPAILIVAVWCATLIGVAVGPIDYPLQPSAPVLLLVATGISLFILAHQGGAWCFRFWLQRRPNLSAPPRRTLNVAVAATSLAGLAGIGLIALDRALLSGVSNGGYAEFLRCAPALVDFIEIKRTPLLYLGYFAFSFGFASLILFLLRGEEISGWAAVLAQLSILSPIGYALLYSGRMPILLVIVLIAAAVLVRIGQGRRALPPGRHLLIKMIVVFVLFAAYSSAMWSSRQNFCTQMSGLIRELQERMQARDLERAPAPILPAQRDQSTPNIRQPNPVESPPSKPNVLNQPELNNAPDRGSPSDRGSTPDGGSTPDRNSSPDQNNRPDQMIGGNQPPAAVLQESGPTRPPGSEDSISGTDLSKMLDAKKASPGGGSREHSSDVGALLAVMQEAWHVRPREYVLSAIETGRLSPDAATGLLSTYFYLTHGIRVLDLTWHARAQLAPLWGVYEVGVLSPILRVFFPANQILSSMNAQLRSAEIYGFFPTVWAAAYIDFGAAGAVIYILIWGFAAGWSGFGARHSALAMPAMLLTFILASVLLSPVQGPLGIANSAMVLISMLITGIAIDFESLRAGSRQPRREAESGTPA